VICTLTARRLNTGAADNFHAAFESIVESFPEEVNTRWKRVYVCRDVNDENVLLTFGFFDGTLEELREIQTRTDRDGFVKRLSQHVEDVLLDGSYEVIDEITP
jgi:hypothetical protein